MAVKVREFGSYRTGSTTERAKFRKTAVKTLHRWGTMQEAVLAGRLHVTVDSEEWTDVWTRLVEWGIVERSERRGSSMFSLTRVGQEWGMELTCESQLEESEANEAARVKANDARLEAEGSL
jgi:hypothetical protein